MVDGASEAVNVGPEIDFPVPHRLLRAHVVGRAHRHPRLREAGAIRRQHLGQAEVAELHRAFAGEENVVGLDVAVHDPRLFPGIIQRLGNVVGDREHLARIDAALAFQPRAERFALHILHGEVMRALILPAA